MFRKRNAISGISSDVETFKWLENDIPRDQIITEDKKYV